jgi:rSAM/selenodomain-associated transferase 2
MIKRLNQKSVSIIVPVLNEADTIIATLHHLNVLCPLPHEIVVVDADSDDRTVELVHEYAKVSVIPIRLVRVQERCRASQINAGVESATGDLVAFLHADTWLSPDAISVMDNVMQNPNVALAGFIAIIQGNGKTWWLINLHHILKTYYAPLIFRPHLFLRGARLLFGDQVMFMRRVDFHSCGGFDDDMVIMEEANLCLKVVKAKLGYVKLVNRTVVTSDRRISRWGGFKSTLLHFYIGILWGIGVSPHYLKRFYADFR